MARQDRKHWSAFDRRRPAVDGAARASAASGREPPALRHGFTTLALALSSTLVASGPMAALQQATSSPTGTLTETFTDAVEVRLIEVDVSVFDKKRRRVEGLTLDDFVLFADGQRVEIADFEEIPVGELIEVPEGGRRGKRNRSREGSPAPQAESSSSVRPSAPLMALFLDEATLTTAVARTLRRTLAQVFEQPGVERLDWMLLRWSMGLRVDSFDSLSLEELIERVAQSPKAPARDIQLGRLRQRTISSIASDFEVYGCTLWENYAASARQYGQELQRLTFDRLDALGAALDAVARTERSATLIALTDQINLRPGIDGFDYVEQICPQYQRQIRQMMFEIDMTPQIQRVAARANAQRTTLVMVDAAGLRPSSGSGVQYAFAGTAPTMRNDQIYNLNSQGSLMQLASETGGSAVFNTNDLTIPVAEAINRSQSNYRIAFQPRHGPRDGKKHTIGVQLAKVGTGRRVEFRRSWFDRTVEQELADGVRAFVLYGIEPPPVASPALRVEASARMTGEEEPMLGLEISAAISAEVVQKLAGLDPMREKRLRLWAFAANDDFQTSARQRLVGLDGGAAGVTVAVPLTDKQRRRGGVWRVGFGARDEATGEVWMKVLEAAAGEAEAEAGREAPQG